MQPNVTYASQWVSPVVRQLGSNEKIVDVSLYPPSLTIRQPIDSV